MNKEGTHVTVLIIVGLLGAITILGLIAGFDTVEISNSNLPSQAQLTLNDLSFEEKVGQRFIIGFQGTTVTSELERKMKELHPGGVLLLRRNIKDEKQLKQLTSNLQEVALEDTGLPLLIAVDQEGGSVCRVDWLRCTPLSEIDNEQQALEIGLSRGRKLKELGINLNLAPVLDEAAPGDYIYPRTFQGKQDGELAQSFIAGQRRASVLSVIKHFPDYGGIGFNPERFKLPRLEKLPSNSQFKAAMNANPPMVMLANVVYSEVSNEYPFSLTAAGVNFTRKKLNPGLIISDDLSSPVLKQNYGLREVVDRASSSGVDVLLVAGFDDIKDTERAINYLKEQTNHQKMNKSLLKIIKLKQEL